MRGGWFDGLLDGSWTGACKGFNLLPFLYELLPKPFAKLEQNFELSFSDGWGSQKIFRDTYFGKGGPMISSLTFNDLLNMSFVECRKPLPTFLLWPLFCPEWLPGRTRSSSINFNWQYFLTDIIKHTMNFACRNKITKSNCSHINFTCREDDTFQRTEPYHRQNKLRWTKIAVIFIAEYF